MDKNGYEREIPERKIAFYNKRLGKNSKLGKYRNLEWEKPFSNNFVTSSKRWTAIYSPDIEQARSITVKEAALLQSFLELRIYWQHGILL